ncbi:MAG: hypothetical protein QGF21_04835 [Vicinamibacterales bacterium]|nr:hypothetical protein [Vicinamibacterales bacterium]
MSAGLSTAGSGSGSTPNACPGSLGGSGWAKSNLQLKSTSPDVTPGRGGDAGRGEAGAGSGALAAVGVGAGPGSRALAGGGLGVGASGAGESTMSSPRSVRRWRSSCGGRRGRPPRRRPGNACSGTAPGPACGEAGCLDLAVLVLILAVFGAAVFRPVAFSLAAFDVVVRERAGLVFAVLGVRPFDRALFDFAELVDFAGFPTLDFAVLRFAAADTCGLRREADFAVFFLAFGFFRPARPRAALARAEREVVFRAPLAALRRVDFEGFLAIVASSIRPVQAVRCVAQERRRGLTPDR